MHDPPSAPSTSAPGRPPTARSILIRFAPTSTTHAVSMMAGSGAPLSASSASLLSPLNTARDLAAAVLEAVGWAGRLAPEALSLTAAGTPLPLHHPLPSTLPLTLTASLARPLPGGGGDGGSTGAECRSAYLEMYRAARPDALDPAEAARQRVTLCRLSGEALAAPIVVDDLGRLYNKDAVVRALLASKNGGGGNVGGGDKKPAALPPHISSLKHVTPATLTLADEEEGGSTATASAARFVCPVTGAPMAGRARFVLLRPSGLVVAERALTAVPDAVREAAGGEWDTPPLLLNPSGEEEAAARAALLARRAAEAARKAAKKAGGGGGGKRGAEAAAEVEGGGGGAKKPAAATETADEAAARAARLKATLALAPDGADKAVFASLFTSSKVPAKETFASRGR